jgi:hypothetical protein
MTTYCYFVRGERHAALANLSIASVRAVDTLASIVVTTDEKIGTRTWQVDAAVCHISPGLPIMLANLEAQINALFFADPAEPIVFLDTDTLVMQKPLVHSDLTITWRDYVDLKDGEKIEGVAALMPYNYGVIMARFGMNTVEAFIWLRERIRKMHIGHQQWYGNQLALAELAGPRPQEGTAHERRRIPWALTTPGNEISITKLPGEIWNYTPRAPDEDVSGKGILHFKGGSRPLMEVYAKRLFLEKAA